MCYSSVQGITGNNIYNMTMTRFIEVTHQDLTLQKHPRSGSVVCHGAGPGLADLGDVVLGQLGPLLGLLQLLLRLPELGQVDGRDLLGLLDLLLVRPDGGIDGKHGELEQSLVRYGCSYGPAAVQLGTHRSYLSSWIFNKCI